MNLAILQSSLVPNSSFGGIEVALLDGSRIALVSSDNDIAYATLNFSNLSLLTSNSIAQAHAQVMPALVSTGSSAFLAYASQPSGYHADEYGFFIGADGTKGPTLSLMDNWGGADWEPSLVRFSDGTIVMTFISERNGNYDVWAQNLNADGSKSGALYLASGALPNHQMMYGGDLAVALPGSKLFLQGWRTIPLSGANANGPRSIGMALVNSETGTVVQSATVADGLATFPLSSAETLAVNAAGDGLIFYQSAGTLFYGKFSATQTGFTLGATTQAVLPKTGLVNVDVAAVVLPNGNIAAAVSGTDGTRQYVFLLDIDVATGSIANALTLFDQSIAGISGLSSVDAFTAETGWQLPIDIAINGTEIVVAYRDAVQNGVGLTTLSFEAANSAPAITSNGGGDTSNGGGDTAAISIAENSTAVTTVTANDPDANTTLSYAISGGADAALFQIDAATGALSFKAAPNFEAPSDVGANNVYDVEVQVSDGALTDTQAIAVTVYNLTKEPLNLNLPAGPVEGMLGHVDKRLQP